MRVLKLLSLSGVILMCFSCKQNAPTPLFQLVTDSGVSFENTVEDGKLDNSFLFRNFYNGGGVATGDINNDGLADIFLTSNTGENKLYLNKGNFKFEDITVKAQIVKDDKWYTGVVFADLNNDGWLDIYVCSSGHMSTGNRKSKLFINNRDLTFTESAANYGLDISAYTTHVSFFDYDLDGDLDCFMINNSPIPVNQLNFSNLRSLPEKQWSVGEFLKGGGDHLFRNDNGRFVEVTYQSGIHGSLISFGLGVSVGDINDDGYPDIFVSNDSYEREYLYINQRDGTFKDEFEEWVEHCSMSSMGADIADINNDGYPDIFTTDMLPDDDHRLKTTGAFDNIDLYRTKEKTGLHRQFVKNCLFLNNKNGKYLEVADYSGVSASDWSWGALFFDADNDGFTDIYVCNGVNRDVIDLDFMDFFANDVIQKMILTGKKENVDEVLKKVPRNPLLNKMYRNKGDLRFEDVGQSWGFTIPSFSNGAAYSDLDNDGDLDLVVNNENMLSFVYRNNSREQNGNSYIGISLKGRGGNRYAIGSKIKVYREGQVYYREVVPSRGFQSSVDYKQIIGLGQLKQVDSMIVIWPDRSYSKYERPELNKVHVLEQPEQIGPIAKAVEVKPPPLLEPVTNNVFIKHTEDDYVDFYYERNLPSMLSREGPGVGKGDVNGDGLEDVYIGGAKGQAGQLYVQTASGFARKEQEVFKSYADFEDAAALMFDADKDGDLDLFIGAGGNNVQPNSRELQHRLYINDGKGDYRIQTKSFSNNDMNISVAVNYDYDGDGDEDLFVGSRSVPYNYGMTPGSYVYNNDGSGHFKEVPGEMNAGISRVGMVTGAVWADVNGDEQKELVITGEWMCPRIFAYNKGKNKFEELLNTNLTNLYGWWQTVKAGDMNGDGKMDLILGNIGENFYLRPSVSNPVKLWLNDFDGNGTKEQFVTRVIGGKDMPVFLKREITDQFPGLKKENLKHSDYADKTIQQLFSGEVIKRSEVKQFNYSSSVLAINDGKGGFRVEALPQMLQLSSVNAIALEDVNEDGRLDMIVGGNRFGFPPQFGRLDAGYGHVLLNEGKGKYRWIGGQESGVSLRGEIRTIENIKGNGTQRYLLMVLNDQLPVLYKVK
jgi:enediyne biosynthesis protein E4